MLWTTLVCIGGEIRGNAFFGPNIYSNDLYTSVESAEKEAYKWQNPQYNQGECITFMVQKEDVYSKKIIKEILGLY
jgi:hypothetical protein